MSSLKGRVVITHNHNVYMYIKKGTNAVPKQARLLYCGYTGLADNS